MGWKELLIDENAGEDFPWIGGRSLRFNERSFLIHGELPNDFGWYRFKTKNRTASLVGSASPSEERLKWDVKGYLVGDRIVPDGIRVDPRPDQIVRCSETVFLLEEGLDRFERVVAGRMCEDGPLFFKTRDFPLGPETLVLDAFLDQTESVDHIPGVHPALDAAFRMETWQRNDAERRRLRIEQKRREEEERIKKEEERRRLMERIGSPVVRRDLARVDFGQAARASLAAGDAEYLDHRKGTQKGEFIVRFKIDGRKFECVCDTRMQVVEAGCCLVSHETGIAGDRLLSLESLPSTYREAIRLNKLVVFRHAY